MQIHANAWILHYTTRRWSSCIFLFEAEQLTHLAALEVCLLQWTDGVSSVWVLLAISVDKEKYAAHEAPISLPRTARLIVFSLDVTMQSRNVRSASATAKSVLTPSALRMKGPHTVHIPRRAKLQLIQT